MAKEQKKERPSFAATKELYYQLFMQIIVEIEIADLMQFFESISKLYRLETTKDQQTKKVEKTLAYNALIEAMGKFKKNKFASIANLKYILNELKDHQTILRVELKTAQPQKAPKYRLHKSLNSELYLTFISRIILIEINADTIKIFFEKVLELYELQHDTKKDAETKKAERTLAYNALIDEMKAQKKTDNFENLKNLKSVLDEIGTFQILLKKPQAQSAK